MVQTVLPKKHQELFCMQVAKMIFLIIITSLTFMVFLFLNNFKICSYLCHKCCKFSPLLCVSKNSLHFENHSTNYIVHKIKPASHISRTYPCLIWIIAFVGSFPGLSSVSVRQGCSKSLFISRLTHYTIDHSPCDRWFSQLSPGNE